MYKTSLDLGKSSTLLRDKENENAMQVIFTSKNKNAKYLKEYYSYCKMQGNTVRTTYTKMKVLSWMFNGIKKDAKAITRKDIENYLASRNDLRSATIGLWKILIKSFFKWVYQLPDDKYPDNVKWIEVKRDRQEFIKDILTRDEMKAIQNNTLKTRDKALISLLYDGGLRVGEALNLKIKDIMFDSYGIKIRATGKTGTREVRLVDSVPIVKQWLNEHPFKDNKDVSLFISLGKGYGRALNTPTVYQIIHEATIRAKIKKNVHPHLFRHTKLTHLAQEGFNEMELRVFAGWSKSSYMPEVYLHINSNNVDEKIRKKNGMISPDEEKRIEEDKKILKVRVCPMCQEKNDVNNKFCFKCGQILDIKAIRDIEKAKEVIVLSEEKENEIIERLRKQVFAEVVNEINK